MLSLIIRFCPKRRREKAWQELLAFVGLSSGENKKQGSPLLSTVIYLATQFACSFVVLYFFTAVVVANVDESAVLQPLAFLYLVAIPRTDHSLQWRPLHRRQAFTKINFFDRLSIKGQEDIFGDIPAIGEKNGRCKEKPGKKCIDR